MHAYLLDEGFLLTKEDEEFEGYSSVYDKKYGYWDDDQCYVQNEQEAIEYAKEYVKNGIDNTYAVVSLTWLPDDFFDFEDEDDIEFGFVENESYLVDDVIYSVAKFNGEIVENFIENKK